MTKEMKLRSIRTHFSKLREILYFELGNRLYSSDFINQTVICAEEAFANIINHAYKKNSHKVIDVKIEITFDMCKIIFVDEGVEFRDFKLPNSLKDLNNKVGGLGLYLINKFSDQFLYERIGNLNITTIIKYKKNEVENEI